MSDSKETLLGEIAAFVEANPYQVYGDRNDELTDEQIDLLLEDRQKFDEAWGEVEINASDYADWSELQREVVEQFGERIMEEFPDDFAKNDEADDLEWRDMPDEVEQTFFENTVVDCSDLLKTCLRHASAYMIAVPLDPDAPDADEDEGGAIGPPNADLDEEQNEARQRYLAEKFGIDGWAAESCYYHETLKVMGKLDLEEVYEKGKPKAITIGPDSSLIFHTGWNGSGCLGAVKATKTVTLPARFQRDCGKYGIQAVYGFVGSVWAEDLEVAEWEPWQ